MPPPIWQLIRDAAQQLGGEMSYPQIKQRIWVEHPDINSTSLTCQIIACSVNHASRVHYSENKSPRLSSGSYDFLFNTGRGKVTIYDSSKHGQWEIAQTEDGLKVQLLEEATTDTDVPLDDVAASGGAFALEAHLRDYLATHLPAIDGESPLKLYVDQDGRDGVEFQTEVGPIDILAVSSTGDFHVFELKLGRGPDAALGQILRYMGWVQQHLCNGKNVSGVIVAAEISKKLKYATTQVPNVRLMEYDLEVTLKPTQLETGT